ncbi:hypothetical protein SAMN02745148_01741 [Modicisalibacter ilicicola DSM 19980]|uniref:Uncharacterized protein n=1 Tax=Modicisalibacter ilicicola DSM 19980 TaxID=1121942 RepID=A0A1M4YJU3_9GAMM|nr:hypothetical protein [Halomonas ilicicola]SHF05957.1 hypothetical protein SAMN02745148_01741 [Halomonas ilicicola DSM 19980]
MLISDSMPLLWLSYLALSLVVLVTGYLAIRWLPRLPRFVITGFVAGALWTPKGFTLSRLEGEAPYEGLAPAVVVGGVAFLQNEGQVLASALALLMLGAGLGVAVGVMLWGWLRRRDGLRQGERETRSDRAERAGSVQRRQEPMIG